VHLAKFFALEAFQPFQTMQQTVIPAISALREGVERGKETCDLRQEDVIRYIQYRIQH